MGDKHKHADCIVAWANGKDVEVMDSRGNFVPVCPHPAWYEHMEYRIKPEPKPDVVRYMTASVKDIFGPNLTYNTSQAMPYMTENCNIKLTFDGETEELKSAEVIS